MHSPIMPRGPFFVYPIIFFSILLCTSLSTTTQSFIFLLFASSFAWTRTESATWSVPEQRGSPSVPQMDARSCRAASSSVPNAVTLSWRSSGDPAKVSAAYCLDFWGLELWPGGHFQGNWCFNSPTESFGLVLILCFHFYIDTCKPEALSAAPGLGNAASAVPLCSVMPMICQLGLFLPNISTERNSHSWWMQPWETEGHFTQSMGNSALLINVWKTFWK